MLKKILKKLFKKFNNPLHDIDYIFANLPGHIYWLDRNNVTQGCNNVQARANGLGSPEEIIGKRNKDLIRFLGSEKVAAELDAINERVMATGQSLLLEETIKPNGKLAHFISHKIPLLDTLGEVIGLLGVSLNITEIKEKAEAASTEQHKLKVALDSIIARLPGHIYWKDLDGIYLGCNDTQAKSLGLNSGAEAVGKTDFELPWPEGSAIKFRENDLYVIQNKQAITVEEPGIFNGKPATMLSQKMPLYDSQGGIFGILGISFDITDRKEKERLALENEVHKKSLQEQEKFKKIAEQVAHDIRSPIASLLMLVRACQEIPEAERIALREVATSIGDIANNLLNKYRSKELETTNIEERGPILVSALLLQLLTDKKYQYQELPVKFAHYFSQEGNFAFIKVEAIDLKRAVSNLINNAVESLDKKEGKITLKLDASKEWVRIMIQDNGKGIAPELLEKIMQNITITEGKKEGHGIGLMQVREALERNQGELRIDSRAEEGTQITLSFSRTKAPSWIAEEIILGSEDIVIILDDDASIHAAWNAHFESILKDTPSIELKHFEMAKDALDFISNLSKENKSKIFLLTDYELIKQNLNGLQVVEQSQVERSILVTSHYANLAIREHAAQIGTRILPKQLASEIPIKIDPNITYKYTTAPQLQRVDLVLVDDDETFSNMLINLVLDDLIVDHYADPRHFLKNLEKYSKDTKICLDNNFDKGGFKGLEIAKKLHEQGYTQLHMLTGEIFAPEQIPEFLVVIRKDDIEGIKSLQ